MRSRRSYQSPHSIESLDLRKLGDILMTRRGEQAAIRARDLVVLLGLGHRDGYPERSIREAVVILIGQGLPIGSTVTEPAGYFIITNEAELQKCVANYMARAKAIEKKALALVDAFRKGPAQPALRLDARGNGSGDKV